MQTKSPLALRDWIFFKKGRILRLVLALPRQMREKRRLFEPVAPSIEEELTRLCKKLHQAGIRTYAMIAPLLPGAGIYRKCSPARVD